MGKYFRLNCVFDKMHPLTTTISCGIRKPLLILCAFSVKIGVKLLAWNRQAAALHTLSGLYEVPDHCRPLGWQSAPERMVLS